MKYWNFLLILLLAACNGSREGHLAEAEYATMDSVPFNVEVNTAANAYIVKAYPEATMFRVEYPSHKALVKYGIVHSADSAMIMKAYTGQLNRMGDRVYYSDFGIDTVSNGDGIKGWIFTSAPDKYPLQMIVTDSATMVLHGSMLFTEPTTDTAGVIMPAIEAVAADMRHMASVLKLQDSIR